MNEVFVVAAQRTPIGSFLGNLADRSAPELGAHAIGAAVRAAGTDPAAIDEVLMGCVISAGIGQAPARQAMRLAEIPDRVGATTVNKVCGSGMKATMLGTDLIRAGSARRVVAGGMESMSNAPTSSQRRGGASAWGTANSSTRCSSTVSRTPRPAARWGASPSRRPTGTR